VIFIDAIVVKVRDGQVANRTVVRGHRCLPGRRSGHFGLWAGSGGEGAKFWFSVCTELKNRGVGDVLMAVCDGLTGLPNRALMLERLGHAFSRRGRSTRPCAVSSSPAPPTAASTVTRLAPAFASKYTTAATLCGSVRYGRSGSSGKFFGFPVRFSFSATVFPRTSFSIPPIWSKACSSCV